MLCSIRVKSSSKLGAPPAWFSDIWKPFLLTSATSRILCSSSSSTYRVKALEFLDKLSRTIVVMNTRNIAFQAYQYLRNSVSPDMCQQILAHRTGCRARRRATFEKGMHGHLSHPDCRSLADTRRELSLSLNAKYSDVLRTPKQPETESRRGNRKDDHWQKGKALGSTTEDATNSTGNRLQSPYRRTGVTLRSRYGAPGIDACGEHHPVEKYQAVLKW
ncbi:hypothetical protein C8Q80DRAFT_187786 [Daedaleopsis nitida]|nr:hypothetical protein C8Q80DRAFT_187786 [Daedaleopsis nitida]